MPKWEIEDIDYWENDAILNIEGKRHYFQFSGSDASLEQALGFLFREGKVEIK